MNSLVIFQVDLERVSLFFHVRAPNRLAHNPLFHYLPLVQQKRKEEKRREEKRREDFSIRIFIRVPPKDFC